MASSSSLERELQLVEKVDLRILNVANNEEKLRQLLKIYLAPLLLKAESEHAAVRSKVVTIAQRLKTFIQPPGIILPVGALIDQYKATSSFLVKKLDLIFIQHSVGRLDPSERRELIPKILDGLGRDSSHTSLPGMFNVFLKMLRDLRPPPRGDKEDGAFRATIGLSNDQDAQFVAHRLGTLFLFRPAAPGKSALQETEVNFLTLDQPGTWDAAEPGGLPLAEVRIKAANFLASGAFTDEERFLPALYASSSADGRVSNIGEDLLKRTTVSLEKPQLVEQLFQAHSRLPAANRTRILGLLSKSAISATYAGEVSAVAHRDLDPRNDGTLAAGLERTKLRKALFDYLAWVARVGPDKGSFKRLGTSLIALLLSFVEEQGWPVSTGLSPDEIVFRGRAYETVGMLARDTDLEQARDGNDGKLSLLGWLFKSLSEDPLPDVVVNIDGAVSSLISAFRPPLPESSALFIRTLSQIYMTKSEGGSTVRSARHAAVKLANQCLPFSDIHARWADILAIAGRRGERSDTVEEGRKGLDPWHYRVDSERAPVLPDWHAMAEDFFDSPTPSDDAPVPTAPTGAACFAKFAGETLDAFPLAVDYCKKMLLLRALPDFKLEPGWADRLQTMIRSDLKTRETVRTYLKSAKSVFTLLDAAFHGMLLYDKPEIAEACASAAVDLLTLAPEDSTSRFAPYAADLVPLIKSNRKEIRQLAATAFGIAAAHPAHSADAFDNSLKTLGAHMTLWRTAIGAELNAVEGSFVAAGHLCSRRIYYLGRGNDTSQEIEKSIAHYLPGPKDVSDKMSKASQKAIFDALSQLWTAGIWWSAADSDDAKTEEQVKSWVSALTTSAKASSEKAITALGRLPIALDADALRRGLQPSEELVSSILNKLYELHELKNVEIQLTIGEAIAAAIAGWSADVVQLTLDVNTTVSDYNIQAQPARFEAALDKVLEDCKSTKPSLLKASGIWLFCIIQNCSHLPQIQSKLRKCQVAFMGLLSARDTLVQETASRGLSLVYEKGDPALRGELVKDLVSTFTGSGPKIKVEGETELFDAGALPTSEGNSVTSYKDIVSLANEVGDQSLVYRFMSLASNAATWNTRSAFGRFGLSSILSESEVDPKLYPKLYRYRFDPNTNVRRSMDDIWKALVKDSNAVLDAHLSDILEDLLQSILGREWRVREASCAAIADLLQGRPFPKYEKYYKDIWTAALKVLDDVKATVRAAALNLCISLSNTLVRLLEESGKSAATTAMMKEALPFLLSDKGIESSVQDVKLFATVTVLKIAKAGGAALKPYIATVIPQLLGLLSTIEPEELNYQYQRMGDEHREKIDKLRSAWINRSPITEAIENVLRTAADDSTMPELASALEETTKTAIGMPTKLGCARVLTVLATRHPQAFTPYAARFLRLAADKLILERNDEVSQGYAASAAYMVRCAPSDGQLRYAERLTALYFAAEDETRREKVADAVLALSKLSPDHFAALETQLLPLAYFGSHDEEDDYVAKALGEVWGKHAGASARSVTRFSAEIVALAARALDAPMWALKHAGALTVAGLVGAATATGDATGQANPAVLRDVWPVYEKALALKTFAGKEKLLEVFPDFAEKALQVPGQDQDRSLASTLHKIAVREAKRNSEAYRPHAFRCLWRFARGTADVDMHGEVIGIVTPSLEAYRDKQDEMDVDEGKGAKEAKREKEDNLSKAAESAVEAVARGFHPSRLQDSGSDVVKRIIEVLKPYLTSAGFGLVKRQVWYKSVGDIMQDITKASAAQETAGSAGLDAPVALEYIATLDLDTAAIGTEEQRGRRAKAVLALLKAAKENVEVATGLKERLQTALEAERSPEVRKTWKEALAKL